MTEYWMPYRIWDGIWRDADTPVYEEIDDWLMCEYGLEAVFEENGHDYLCRENEADDDEEYCYRVHDEKKLALFLLEWL